MVNFPIRHKKYDSKINREPTVMQSGAANQFQMIKSRLIYTFGKMNLYHP
jgi:hypothetical protein